MNKLVLLACVLVVSVASAYAQFSFTNMECLGSTLTTARGISNNGEIVGSYSMGGPTRRPNKNGQCAFLAPTTVLGTNYSDAWKNNNRGDMVGVFRDNAGTAHGFFLSKEGRADATRLSRAGDTTALGINESGTVVGYFEVYDSQGNLARATVLPGMAASSLRWTFPAPWTQPWQASTPSATSWAHRTLASGYRHPWVRPLEEGTVHQLRCSGTRSYIHSVGRHQREWSDCGCVR